MGKNKDVDAAIKGLVNGNKITEKKESTEVEGVDKDKNNTPNPEEPKKKSTRGRKPKSNVKTSVQFVGKKVKITNLEEVEQKVSKTVYITTKTINTLEQYAKLTGMAQGDLLDIAVELLKNNVILEGFKDTEPKEPTTETETESKEE